jgi:hypothetical protein
MVDLLSPNVAAGVIRAPSAELSTGLCSGTAFALIEPLLLFGYGHGPSSSGFSLGRVRTDAKRVDHPASRADLEVSPDELITELLQSSLDHQHVVDVETRPDFVAFLVLENPDGFLHGFSSDETAGESQRLLQHGAVLDLADEPFASLLVQSPSDLPSTALVDRKELGDTLRIAGFSLSNQYRFSAGISAAFRGCVAGKGKARLD